MYLGKVRSIVLCAALLIAVPCLAQTFRDPNLQAAVEAALGHPAGDSEELLSLTVLDATARGIVDLGGIESLANLTALDLADNQVVDLSPLSGLTSLTHLSLERNLVADLAPLASLSHLQVLLLLGNQVPDLAPLLWLSALVEVDVRGNPLSSTTLDKILPSLVDRGVLVVYDPADSGTATNDTGWVFIGPAPPAWMSPVPELTVAPGDPDALYALTDLGLCLSRDAGVTWEQTGLMAGPSEQSMNVAVDAGNPATIYTLADGLRSTDWGAHWQHLPVPGQLFAVDRTQGGRLYCRRAGAGVGGADLVAISDDGGQTWRDTDVQVTGWQLNVSRHPAASGVIYLSSVGWNAQGRRAQHEFYRSDDDGLAWRAFTWSQDFATVVGDPADAASLYAIREGLVFHSSDLGATWAQVGALGMSTFNSLAVHSVDTSWAWAWADDRAMQSHDAGRTWKRLAFVPLEIQSHPTDPAQAFAFTGWQTWHTRDGGVSWNLVTLNAATCPVRALGVDTAGVLYAGTYHRAPVMPLPEIKRSVDDGASWEVVRLPDTLGAGEISMIYPNPLDPDLLLAYPGSGASFLRSDDGGQQWQSITMGEDTYVSPRPSEVSTTGPDLRIYYLLQPLTRTLYRSDDAAATWTRVGIRRLDHLAVHPTDDQALFAVAAGELLRSGDGGVTWDTFRQSERQDSTLAIAITPNPPNRLLALTTQALYDCGMAADDGCVARPAPHPVLSADLSDAFLRCDPVAPNSLYLVLPHEIWSTRDVGETWQRLAFSPAEVPYFTGLVISPQDPSLIFVSTPWGVYRAVQEQVTAVSGIPGAAPARCSLAQNYPNPFNAQTTIVYQLPRHQQVSLVIYDILGRSVRRLVTGEQAPGEYRLAWDGRDDQEREVASGMYLCRLATDTGNRSIRLALVR